MYCSLVSQCHTLVAQAEIEVMATEAQMGQAYWVRDDVLRAGFETETQTET